jgi:hypothetical protein
VWGFADGSIASLSTVGIPAKSVADLPDVGQGSLVTIGRHSGVRVSGIVSPDECEIDLDVGVKMAIGVLVVAAGTADAACGKALQGMTVIESKLP